MFFKISFHPDFEQLMHNLWSMYGKELFDIDGIGKQTDMRDFTSKFFGGGLGTTADASVDSNSNVTDLNVIAYLHEFPKPFMRYYSYYRLWEALVESKGRDFANRAIESQLIGDIYINDFTDVQRPYCFNYSTMDIVFDGLPMISKIKSVRPRYLYSFKSQLEQFVTYASNSTLGACGIADVFITMAHFAKKILETGHDAGFYFDGWLDDNERSVIEPLLASMPERKPDGSNDAEIEAITVEINKRLGKVGAASPAWFKRNVLKYVKENIVSFIYTINQPMRGNQCVDEETEVLTPDGFRRYDELSIGDEIYTWDNGRLNVQNVDAVNVYDYDGEMHRYEGRDCVQFVTPNHRVMYKNSLGVWTLKESSELINTKTPLTMPVAMESDERGDYAISDEMLELLVFILTDGSIETPEYRRPNPRMKWFKSPLRYGAERFEELCVNLKIKFTKTKRDSGFGGELMHYSINGTEARELYALLNGTKCTVPNLFFYLSRRQANLVIDTWAKLDGYSGGSKTKLQADNSNIADALQHVCFLAGRGSRIVERVIGKNKKPTLYVIVYERGAKVAKTKTIEHYKGKVWCPSTKDGVVVFRKDGKIFVSGNSPFTNVSVYDRFFLETLCEGIVFPDGSTPDMALIQEIQGVYLDVMNAELRRTPVTFPVTTACFSIAPDRSIRDEAFARFIAEKNYEFGFINIYHGESSTLSSCCRLRSETKSEYFNSFGAGSTKIGSLGVVTANLPRLAWRSGGDESLFFKNLAKMTELIGEINNAKRNIIRGQVGKGALPLYTLGYMDLKKQYSTFGATGIYEMCKIMGHDMLEPEGQDFVIKCFQVVNSVNEALEKKYKAPHNCEQVPAENSSIKLVQKDNFLGFNKEGYELYSNQFIPLTSDADMLDRIYLQGKFDGQFTGGAICHINVEQRPKSPDFDFELIKSCSKAGVIYWARNSNLQECKNGHMTVGRDETCSKCGAPIENNYTRVVGFLTAVKHWHKVRREVDYPHRKFY